MLAIVSSFKITDKWTIYLAWHTNSYDRLAYFTTVAFSSKISVGVIIRFLIDAH